MRLVANRSSYNSLNAFRFIHNIDVVIAAEAYLGGSVYDKS